MVTIRSQERIEMTWKKTLIRNFLFAVLVMAAGFYCTGCC